MAMHAFHDLVAAITAFLSCLEHDLILHRHSLTTTWQRTTSPRSSVTAGERSGGAWLGTRIRRRCAYANGSRR
jgi:hypothetical protein